MAQVCFGWVDCLQADHQYLADLACHYSLVDGLLATVAAKQDHLYYVLDVIVIGLDVYSYDEIGSLSKIISHRGPKAYLGSV